MKYQFIRDYEAVFLFEIICKSLRIDFVTIEDGNGNAFSLGLIGLNNIIKQ